MNRFVVISFLLGCAWVLSAQDVAAVEWRISLTPAPQYASAKAKAKYKDRGGERELQIEVENLRSLRGTKLQVRINGAFAGQMPVTAFGTARFSRNTDLGQSVPVVRRGSTIIIRRPSGAQVFSGTF